MAAAACKKRPTSLSLFMEAFGLEVEEKLFATATQTWAEGIWIGNWCIVQKEAWMKQVFEGADLETSERTCRSCHLRNSNLGTKWPQLHTLIF